MKPQKDIFSVIGEGAHKLKMTPSPAAWQKLENRLGQQRQKSGKIIWLKRVSVAAAVLFLLGGTYWWNVNLRTDALGFQHDPAPRLLEELESTGGCEPYCLMLEARKLLPYEYAYPVQKGG